jgi:hypothetical protein
MKRRVLMILSALSLALCMATTAECLRSYWRKDRFEFVHRGVLWEIAAERGRVSVENEPEIIADNVWTNITQHALDVNAQFMREDASSARKLLLEDLKLNHEDRRSGAEPDKLTEQLTANNRQETKLGFSMRHFHNAMVSLNRIRAARQHPIAIIHSIHVFWIASGLSVLPLISLAAFLQQVKRKAAGKCLLCGYDLRATPDRCPECGTSIAKAAGKTLATDEDR